MQTSNTPIFDDVLAETHIEIMPLAPFPTHQEFLANTGYTKWIEDVQRGIVRADGRPKKVARIRPVKG